MLFIMAGFIIPHKAQGAQLPINTATGIKKLKTADINAVILGDSIAVSQDASDPLTTGWDSDLNTLISRKYSHRILWNNKAKSGTLVDYCLQRAEEIDSKTDAVFICVGRNDRNFYTPGQFCLKYSDLIWMVHRKAPKADIFCIVEPPMVSSDDSSFTAIRSQIIVNAFNDQANSIDVWSDFPIKQRDLADVLSDGLHPNDAGYKIMSYSIGKKLFSIIDSGK